MPILNASHKNGGSVAAGDQKTAQAAVTTLEDGGNAFDAVISAIFTSCVSEPVLSSLGGGGFMLARLANGESQLFDFFTQTPFQKQVGHEIDFQEITADFGTITQNFHMGWGSIATPGLVAGAFHIHNRLGSIPMAKIIEPACHLAKTPTPIPPLQAHIIDVVSPIMLASQSARTVYESKTHAGFTLQTGEAHHLPDHAGLLENLVREGPDLFYRGEIADQIATACGNHGGFLTRRDLENYQVIERASLQAGFAGAKISTNPYPSSGGALIIFALKLLEHQLAQDLTPPLPSRWTALLAEVMELTNLARRQSGFALEVSTKTLGKLMDPNLITEFQAELQNRALKIGGTTHITVADKRGNIASVTLSNGEGCGHILKGTGMMLNNMLGEEDINPAGFFIWAPNRRISSMMAPSLIDLPDGSCIALGSGGSNRIRSAILQVIANLTHQQMDLDQAIHAPRIHYEQGVLNIEQGQPPETLAILDRLYPQRHNWSGQSFFFGGVHAVRLDKAGKLEGVGDKRRAGVYLET
jgi:gamma-glutamyltranspeptidase/glutathione hydrolase